MTKKIKLPVTYMNARKALAKCVKVDECQRWADKAAALAAYGRQMKDGKLEADATRIRDRAIRRGGELLSQIKPAKGARTDLGHRGARGRDGAAKGAGLSPGQAKQMLRVAKVPEEQFETLVEGANPPSPKMLAEIGTNKQPKPEPKPYRNEWIDWTLAVRRLATLPACGLAVLATRNQFELPTLLDQARAAVDNLASWLEELEEAHEVHRENAA